MFLRVFIPRFHHVEQGSSAATATSTAATNSTPTAAASEVSTTAPAASSASSKSHFVYEIEISIEGKFYRIQRRYSQFLTLHNEVGSLVSCYVTFET